MGKGSWSGVRARESSYETTGNFCLDAGTVSVWVKPETWDDTDSAMRFFFAVNEADTHVPQDGGTFLWLYRFFSQTTYFLVWDSREHSTYAGNDLNRYFNRGEWVHLVGTWNGNELRLYANGKLRGSARVSTPRILRSLAPRFTVGDPNRANAADTVLDELRIFNRALTPPEVEALYRFEMQATPARQEVTVTTLPGTKMVRVDVNAIGQRPTELSGLTARVVLKAKTAETSLREKLITRFDAPHATAELSTAGLSPGAYRVVSTLREHGKTLAVDEASFHLNPPPAWLGSKVGLSTEVPAPWTPLAITLEKEAPMTLSCWGPRRYSVGKSLLPSGCFTAARERLAAPITLSGVVNGAPLAWRPGAVTVTKNTPARIEFTSRASSGPVTASAVCFLEYDGLLWTTLTLSAKKPLTVTRLTLDIPLRSETATLMQTGFSLDDAGAVHKWQHRVVANAQIWLGDEDGGLQVTIPSARNWYNADRMRQLELLPSAGQVVLRLNLVDKDVTFDGRVQYEFGLQLTPVRPHPAGWRRWRIAPPQGTPGTCFNPCYTEGWSKGVSYMEPLPYWEKLFTEETRKGNLATLYLQPFSISTALPEYADFAAEWRTSYCNLPPRANPQADPMSFTSVCPHAASWGDYFVTTFCDLLQHRYKDMGWGAVYFDNTYPPLCDNADHGCGYRDEFGVWQPEQCYLENRALQQRFYVALKERWPNKPLINHESGMLNMMQLGFCDGMLDGEHLALALPAEKYNYYHLLPLERMRAEFMGHNYGFVPIFLPEFTRASAGNAAVTAHFTADTEAPEVMHLLGLLLLHDILPYNAWSNQSPYVHLWAMEEAFGWDDEVVFVPYWRNPSVSLRPKTRISSARSTSARGKCCWW